MLKALTVLTLLLTPVTAQAKTFKLGDPPAAEITFPDAGWTVEAAEGAVEVTASNGDAYLSADVYDGSEVADAFKATARFLVEQKIKLDPKSKTQKETETAGLQTFETSWTGTDEDGPTRFRLSLVKIRPDRMVLLIYWRSEAGEAAHSADVQAIATSLKPIK